MTIYERLGVPSALNGVGPATRLGGLPLHDAVWTAMQEALRTSVRMDTLERAAGAHIARLLDVPAAYVTSGASAALFLATAVVLAGDDPAVIDRLPRSTTARNKVVIQSAQRDPYDRAVEAAGATLIPIGYPESTHPGELERELGPDVAAVLFRPGRHGNLLSLENTARIAHEHGVPVIVDGAMFVPPISRLQGFFAAGADLVAVSGGKGFRGPQASGLLCGLPNLIETVALQHQDMDERHETWPVGRQLPSSTPPRHGIGRSMKVGREQIVGLVVAIERHLQAPGAAEAPGRKELDEFVQAVGVDSTLSTKTLRDPALDVDYVELDLSESGATTTRVIVDMASQARPAFLGESEAWRDVLTVNTMALAPGEGILLGRAVLEAVERARS